jgi:hypothetical protein
MQARYLWPEKRKQGRVGDAVRDEASRLLPHALVFELTRSEEVHQMRPECLRDGSSSVHVRAWHGHNSQKEAVYAPHVMMSCLLVKQHVNMCLESY